MRLTTSAAELHVASNAFDRDLRAFEIRRLLRSANGGMRQGIGDDRCQRLIHLMRDRGGELRQARRWLAPRELVGGARAAPLRHAPRSSMS